MSGWNRKGEESGVESGNCLDVGVQEACSDNMTCNWRPE